MTSAHHLSRNGLSPILAVGLLLGWPACVWAQSVTATIPLTLGGGGGLAINTTTDKLYVGASSDQPVNIVDGKTNTVTTPAVNGSAVAVNEATNKIYLLSGNSVTVVDGVTNAATTISDPNANGPCSLAVNPATNKIYVTNCQSGNVTVIDGVTNSPVTVTDPNARGLYAAAVAVNVVTNKIYVANSFFNKPGNITVIDGATNSITTITDPNAIAPNAIAVNPVTNKIYVANYGTYPSGGTNSGNVTVIDGNTNAVTTVTDSHARAPFAVAVDSETNGIYVANVSSNNVTAIDGRSNAVTTITDPNAALPIALAVDETAKRVYVVNMGCTACGNPGSNPGGVTVIDEASRSTTTIIDANFTGPRVATAPNAVVVDSKTDQVYVLNQIGPPGVNAALVVIAPDVTPSTHTLGVVLAGTGLGDVRVTSTPAGIDCGEACDAQFAVGTGITLLPVSEYSGIAFAGWGGACTGTGSCVLTANSDQLVTANFGTAVMVPSVVGDTQAAADAAITAAGLLAGKVTQQPSSTVASGSVINESPAGGTTVGTGAAVDLVVSSGDPSAGGSSGGGGGMDLITLAALLGFLRVGLGRDRKGGRETRFKASTTLEPPRAARATPGSQSAWMSTPEVPVRTSRSILTIEDLRTRRGSMKFREPARAAVLALLAAVTVSSGVAAQVDKQLLLAKATHYAVKDLGTFGGTQGVAEGISNRNWVVGDANLAGDQNVHAFLWRDGVMRDLGTLGGLNSSEQWPVKDDRGLIAGAAETAAVDPFGENFCGFSVPATGLTCQGFLWQDGVMSPLATLGGNNSYATGVNNRGQVVGWAENNTQDPTCRPPAVLFRVEAVLWGPKAGEIEELPPFPGDTVAGASGINDRAQIIGASGPCSNPTSRGVLWEAGTVTDVGNLGGVLNTIPWAINSAGVVAGQSDLSGDTTLHAFVWTKKSGMRDLGTLPGDSASLAFGLNDGGQVVGGSCIDATLNDCRAFLWQNGKMIDMNSLVPAGSTPLYLFFGNDINASGEIAAYAFDQSNGEFHAALAIPCNDAHPEIAAACAETATERAPEAEGVRPVLPANGRKMLNRRLPFRSF